MKITSKEIQRREYTLVLDMDEYLTLRRALEVARNWHASHVVLTPAYAAVAERERALEHEMSLAGSDY